MFWLEILIEYVRLKVIDCIEAMEQIQHGTLMQLKYLPALTMKCPITPPMVDVSAHDTSPQQYTEHRGVMFVLRPGLQKTSVSLALLSPCLAPWIRSRDRRFLRRASAFGIGLLW